MINIIISRERYSTFVSLFFKIIRFSVIEHLPQELRDRFTDMREMDLQVQSKLFAYYLFILFEK